MDYDKMFQKLDADHDKKLTLAEFQKAVEEFGFPACPDKMKAAFEKHDANKNGTLELKEFVQAMKDLVAAYPKIGGMFKAFKEADKDHSGTLDKAELAKAVAKECPQMNVEEAFKKIDADGNGKITLKEWMAYAVKEHKCECK